MLVLIDYLESYKDQTEDEMSKQLTYIKETIFQLPITDQIKTYYAINLGKKPLLKVSAKIFIFEHLQEKKKKII